VADIIAKARAKRQQLLAEVAKIDTFLELAAEFGDDDVGQGALLPNPPPRSRERKPPTQGVVRQTADIVMAYMRAYGEGRKTRELVPVVEGAGVEVGGKDKVATLSARIYTSSMFQMKQGRWFIRQKADEETADSPSKDTSAASLFTTNQEEATNGPALVS
jgi:hypothetical protein